MIEVRRVSYGTPEYGRVVELRQAVLRTPLGMRYSDEEIARDADHVVLAAFDGEQPVGCLTLTDEEDGFTRMRAVAVHPDRQGEGIGRKLVEEAEKAAEEAESLVIFLHARPEAVAFYRHLGYHLEGEPFEEIGIPHRRMTKGLTG